MIRLRLFLVSLLLSGIVFSQSKDNGKQKYANGKELISAMYKAYAPNKWYRYFTFSQNMEFYRNDSLIRQEVWHEAYKPGSLIIKFGTKNSKDGRLYTDFTQHSFKTGE